MLRATSARDTTQMVSGCSGSVASQPASQHRLYTGWAAVSVVSVVMAVVVALICLFSSLAYRYLCSCCFCSNCGPQIHTFFYEHERTL